jgi:hypothetical protein
MNFVRSLLRLLGGLLSFETRKERRDREEREQAGALGLWASGGCLPVLFVTILVGAVVLKVVLKAVTGDSFEITLEGLLTTHVIVMVAAGAVVLFIVMRKLRAWSYGESSSGQLPTRPMGCGMAVLILVGCAGLLTWYIRYNYEESPKQKPAVTAQRKQKAVPHQPQASEPAQPEKATVAETLSVARRASLEQRWRSARSIAVEKWRADVLTANALGEIGAVPPMLGVRETGSHVQLTNRSPSPICVQLARVTRPNTDAVERCQVGPSTCSMVKSGATLRLQVFRTGAMDSCLNAALEFRVGNVDSPEPSWWSRTAFNTFVDPPMDIGYKDEAAIQLDIARFEATVEDQDRAARWRRELATPYQTPRH